MKNFPRKHDIIFRYSVSEKWVFNQIRVPYKNPNQRPRKAFDTGNAFDENEIRKLRESGKPLEDYWMDIAIAVRSPSERTGYPTQKPLKLLERIIKASSNESDIVLDPFCGCATTLVAADRLQRDWIGIDISPKAAELVVERIKADQGLFQDIFHRKDVPKRTDLGDIPRYNTPENKERLYGKQRGNCNGCQTHFEHQNLEVDHIIATSVGETDHISNLQLLCSRCNRVKGNRGQEYLLSRLNLDR